MESTCSNCHTTVRATDYFCFNCGKNLKPKPAPRTPLSLIALFVGSVLLPPMGFWWSLKYFREPEASSKIIGLIAVVLTVVSILAATLAAVSLMNTVNQQVNEALPGMMGI